MSLSQTPNSHVSARGVIPDATVSRLPMYHRSLLSLTARGVLLVSSEELAEASGVSSAKLRKDLSFLGSYGTRGVGYDVEFLLYQIARALGLTQVWPVVIVGIGNLGNALAGYPGFASRGFSVVGLFDTDPNRVGETVTVAGKEIVVTDISKLPQVVLSSGASIGVIATPETAAQEVCDLMVRNGITSILNFAPVLIEVPAGVDVRRVDLATELQILAFHEQRKSQSALTQANAG
ncbi:MAG: redox-sensing transcriptional repressor Rex [Actinobacteria bacterium]|jgi:redox-sensing transcriptional repressor|nr:redox-sensing transcriptional repressor Rex [Actinomycetota bacterium]